MSRGSDGTLGEASCRGALGLPTPCLVETGTCTFVTATHRRGLTTVLTGAHTRRQIYAQSPPLWHIQPDTHVRTHTRMPTATHPQAHVITVAQGHRLPRAIPEVQLLRHMWDHSGPSRHCHRRPLQPSSSSQPGPGTCHSPGPWVAGPARQRWTGAGTGSGCGLPGSPGSGSSQCPSPLSWHLLGWEWGDGVSPSPASQPHPQHWPLLNGRGIQGKATAKKQAVESPRCALHPLGQGWQPGALWPSRQKLPPEETHALELHPCPHRAPANSRSGVVPAGAVRICGALGSNECSVGWGTHHPDHHPCCHTSPTSQRVNLPLDTLPPHQTGLWPPTLGCSRVRAWDPTHINDVGELHRDEGLSWWLCRGPHSHCHHPGCDGQRGPGDRF